MSKTFKLLLILLLAGMAAADASSKKDGPHSCGGVDIPYPFGIGNGAGSGSSREGFEIVCDAGTPGIVFSGDYIIPISQISIETAEARVMLPIGWQCYNSSGDAYASNYTDLQFNEAGVYRISNTSNYLFVLGCSTLGMIGSQEQVSGSNNDTSYTEFTGCLCYCNDSRSAVSGACSGVGCCHADIPPDLVDNALHFDSYNRTDKLSFSACDYAFLAEKDSYTFDTAYLTMDLSGTVRTMPVLLDWAIRDNLTCDEARKKLGGYACVSSNSSCLDARNGPGYICSCSKGYEGNPYIREGCTDINECKREDEYPCKGVCRKKPGSYECKCPRNSHGADPFEEPCSPNFPIAAKSVVGAIGILFIIAIMVFVGLLRKEKRKMKKLFEKNGGPILEKLNNIKLFKKEDIDKILKGSNFIGRGGYGNVYKGRTGDSNQLVAVKKPVANLADKDQFTNEIIIQSRVIHKNIVKLIGCCLEVDVPILVYEFVPKGSLHDILHGSSRMPLDLDLRLHIAAEGLAYMHSKTTTRILHGDVKPANILLNDDFVPKISDFGISRLIPKDMQHTTNVIGDQSYMDPVYFQTGLLTNKSDVYSFEVVLLELITKKKASHSDNNSLLRNFLDAYTKDKSAVGLIDKELAVTDDMELLDRLAGMIKQCLNFDVDQRPEMTDLAESLHAMVKRSHTK